MVYFNYCGSFTINSKGRLTVTYLPSDRITMGAL
jgi:hypothetical protein